MRVNQSEREEAIVNFAEGLLKRTLSDSFAGVALNEDGEPALDIRSLRATRGRPNIKLALAARSVSLELARHKHRLASQLVSGTSLNFLCRWAFDCLIVQNMAFQVSLLGTSIAKGGSNSVRPVATGNWGCGRLRGDPQLKLLIQWMAASVAGSPCLQYYTCANEKLGKVSYHLI